MRPSTLLRTLILPVITSLGLAGAVVAPVSADPPDGRPGRPAPPVPSTPKQATAVGFGGAVSSVDADATRVGLEVLRKGGNAADAAVATAAALGVTEPYSAGVGGGGYFVHYDAATGEVETIDGRETAPAGISHDAFIDPATGEPYPFFPDLVTSGVSVGVPGTPATWERALDRWGSRSLPKLLKPSIKLADRGFVVDQTFHDQTVDNAERFAAIEPTAELFLPGGEAPAVGSRFRNPDLADTYRLLAKRGVDALYRGPLAREIAQTVQSPPTTGDTDLPVPPGSMTQADLAAYAALDRDPTHSTYRGLDVYGMASSSSGGVTVGEALKILEQSDLSAMSDGEAYHHYLEASALAFADRGAYVGDANHVDVPFDDLLSDEWGAERACEIGETALPKPVEAGDVTDYDGECATSGSTPTSTHDTENVETTNLTVADRWGNIVEYTLTIEQTGGSGITVPGRGFLLNNELTDFSTVYDPDDPNRIEPGKRPRSSMSPTIVLEDGEPLLAVGTPGGSTIITTVLQLLVERLDRGTTLPGAMAAPRASQRNGATTAEPDFIAAYADDLAPFGQELDPVDELGAATGIELGPGGMLTASAEPWRRGGGAAAVLHPVP